MLAGGYTAPGGTSACALPLRDLLVPSRTATRNDKPREDDQNKITCKLHMKFVFWFQDLNVEGYVGSKVLDSPRSQDCLLILEKR